MADAGGHCPLRASEPLPRSSPSRTRRRQRVSQPKVPLDDQSPGQEFEAEAAIVKQFAGPREISLPNQIAVRHLASVNILGAAWTRRPISGDKATHQSGKALKSGPAGCLAILNVAGGLDQLLTSC